MTDHSTARRMQQAADDMQQAARNIDSTLNHFQIFLDDWLLRLENVLERQLAPRVINVENRVDDRALPGMVDAMRREIRPAPDLLRDVEDQPFNPDFEPLLSDEQLMRRAQLEATGMSSDVIDETIAAEALPPAVTGQAEIDPSTTAQDLGANGEADEERARRVQELHEVRDGAYGDGPALRGAARDELVRLGEIPPALSKTERFLLEWLSKEETSAYGECSGKDLDRLVNLGYAQIEPAGPAPRPDSRVSLTEAGWERYRQIIRES